MFRFRQFSIDDDRCGMKVGTDGILLGAWTQVGNVAHILDIGTGCGLLAIMLAQRFPQANITAIEIEPNAAEQAAENVMRCPWSERIDVHPVSLQQYAQTATYMFDAIICNPPYFHKAMPALDEARHIARHSDLLSFDTLCSHAHRILAEDGSLHMIVPYESCIDIAQLHGFYVRRHTAVSSRVNSSPIRSLLHFAKKRPRQVLVDHIHLYDEPHERSKKFHSLTCDFYLADDSASYAGK